MPATTRKARKRLNRELGPSGEVRTDRVTGAVAYVGRTDRLLTEPYPQYSPRRIVLDYLRSHREVFGLDDRDIANLRLVARSVSPDGITHLRFNQVLGGILSFDSGVDGHVTADGRLINVSGSPVPGARLPASTPSLTPRAGLHRARRAVNGSEQLPRTSETAPGGDRTTTFASGERVVLRWSATSEGPRLVWSALADDTEGQTYDVLIDAEDGSLLRRQNLTAHSGSARYFPADPLRTPDPVQIDMPEAWYDDHAGGTRLWGQFSRTYIDGNGVDPEPGDEANPDITQIPSTSADPEAPDWLYTQSTDFPDAGPCPPTGCTWDGPFRETAEVNQFQAGTNAHVQVNRFHEHLLAPPIGFDEASGNFQRTNTSGEGLGNDYVRTEVNDGSGLDNANFSTPPDGIPGRMQLYLYTRRDINGGDIADLIFHEYTHGLSNRLVVNASGSSALSHFQSKMMGEGWSDFYALDLLVHEGHINDSAAAGEVVRNYYVFSPWGSRVKPIDCPVNTSNTVEACNESPSTYPIETIVGGYTYGDLAIFYRSTLPPAFNPLYSSSPHLGGEFWAQTLWDIRSALGRETALTLITGGMRLSVDAPSMLDMRDAILQQAVAIRSALGASDDYTDELWEIFRKRGLGADASTPSAASTTPHEGFSLVKAAGPMTFTDPYPGGDNDGILEPGEQIEIQQPIDSVSGSAVTSISGTLSTGSGATVVASNSPWPNISPGTQESNTNRLAVRLPTSCNASIPLTITLNTSTGQAKVRGSVDPRLGSSEEIPLADATPEGPGVTTAEIEVDGTGVLSDVDLRIDDLRHLRLGDLKIELLHDGKSVVALDDLLWTGRDIIDLVLDDSGSEPLLHYANPGLFTGRWRPWAGGSPTQLSTFNGSPAAGTWTLRISDEVEGESGVLRRWGINSPQLTCAGKLEIPVAQTVAATNIGQESATLRGTVNPKGRETGLRFAYGLTAAYGETSEVVSVGDGETAVDGTYELTGLAPDTTYHYRVEAIREGGQVAVVGADRTFTTAQTPTPSTPPSLPPPSKPSAPPSASTPEPPAAVDRQAPRLTHIQIRLAAPTKKPRTAARRVTVVFSITESARVSAVVDRRINGHLVRGRCIATSTRQRKAGRPCVRRVKSARGGVAVRRPGRGQLQIAGRGLAPGTYTITLSAVDASGNRSRPASIRFKVPPARKR